MDPGRWFVGATGRSPMGSWKGKFRLTIFERLDYKSEIRISKSETNPKFE